MKHQLGEGPRELSSLESNGACKSTSLVVASSNFHSRYFLFLKHARKFRPGRPGIRHHHKKNETPTARELLSFESDGVQVEEDIEWKKTDRKRKILTNEKRPSPESNRVQVHAAHYWAFLIVLNSSIKFEGDVSAQFRITPSRKIDAPTTRKNKLPTAEKLPSFESNGASKSKEIYVGVKKTDRKKIPHERETAQARVERVTLPTCWVDLTIECRRCTLVNDSATVNGRDRLKKPAEKILENEHTAQPRVERVNLLTHLETPSNRVQSSHFKD
ncbi:hypothetical protein B0H11DRAFT_1908472 [Mycena galericulata]|nr:hypothetical protein B0H11DRAFT_1908472 [Mycena galericulata]